MTLTFSDASLNKFLRKYMSSEVDDFLANVPTEGPVDIDKELFGKPKEGDKVETEKTPTASPAETKTKTEEPASPQAGENKNTEDDNNIPFHKHPRWKERERQFNETKKQYEDRLAQMEAKLTELGNSSSAKKTSAVDTSAIPQWFVELYGDNPLAWQKYEQAQEMQYAQWRDRLVKETEQLDQKEQAQLKEANKFVEDSISKLEEQYDIDLSYQDGKNSLRNEFLNFMLERRPSTEDGTYDFINGWKWFSETRTKEPVDETTAAKKNVAAKTVPSKKAEAASKEFATPNDLRGDWRTLIRK